MKQRNMVLIAIMSMLLACGCAAGQHESPGFTLNELGTKAHDKGDYETAVRYYKSALEHAPDDAVIWQNLGHTCFWKKDYRDAAKAYTKTLEFQPNNESALCWRGWSYYYISEFNKAIIDFDRIILSKKYRLDALCGRGWSYYKKGMHKNAFNDFEAAVQMNPNDQDGLRGRAWTCYHAGNFPAAIRDFTRALEHVKPDNKNHNRDALFGKALAYLGVRDKESAVHFVDKARDFGLGDSYLIMFYLLSGDRQKAWQLRGGEGQVGLKVKDHRKGQMAGAEVVRVTEDSSAVEAGFLERDVVTAANKTPVHGAGDWHRAVALLTPGATAEITVLRENMERKMRVRVESAEREILSAPMAVPLAGGKSGASEGGEVLSADNDAGTPAGQQARPQGPEVTDELN